MEENSLPLDFSGGWEAFMRFEGRGEEYFWILLRNFFLSALTLGLYSFWGKTRARQYVWSRLRVMGEPLEYTGTGKELFLSFLLIMPLCLVGFFVLSMLMQTLPLLMFLTYPLFLFLWEFASYRALRYRLTRTRWRGIRGNMSGSAAEYAGRATLYWLAVFASLGLLLPWASARMTSLKMNNVWFGNRKGVFDGPAKDLFKVYFLCYGSTLLVMLALGAAILTFAGADIRNFLLEEELLPFFLGIWLGLMFLMGLVYSFYRAAYFRWFCGHFAYGKMRLRSDLSGMQTCGLVLTNLLLLACTLGIAGAWVHVRTLRLIFNSVRSVGDPELQELLQDTQSAPSRGEGLLEALDVDIAL